MTVDIISITIIVNLCVFYNSEMCLVCFFCKEFKFYIVEHTLLVVVVVVECQALDSMAA